MCGVPLAYSFQSVFILKHTELSLSDNYIKALFVVLFIAYYIWDTVRAPRWVSVCLLSFTVIPQWCWCV